MPLGWKADVALLSSLIVQISNLLIRQKLIFIAITKKILSSLRRKLLGVLPVNCVAQDQKFQYRKHILL